MTSTDSAYTDAQYLANFPANIDKHYWHVARNSFISSKLKNVANSDTPILDVGCGPGYTVQYLRERGFNAFGSELATPPIAPNLEPYIFTSKAADTLPADIREKISVILMLDVLEHLDDPRGELKKLRVAFPNLRNFLITVPARQELWSNYDEFYGHKLRFNPTQLIGLFAELDIKNLDWTYFFHSLYIPAWLQARRKGGRQVEMTSPKATRLHRWIGKAFYWESLALPKSLPGSSLFANVSLK